MPALDKFIKKVRYYAGIYAIGGYSALKSLELEIFSFPPNCKLYISWILSIITIICVFFGASLSIISLTSKISDIYKKIKEIDSKDLPNKE